MFCIVGDFVDVSVEEGENASIGFGLGELFDPLHNQIQYWVLIKFSLRDALLSIEAYKLLGMLEISS